MYSHPTVARWNNERAKKVRKALIKLKRARMRDLKAVTGMKQEAISHALSQLPAKQNDKRQWYLDNNNELLRNWKRAPGHDDRLA